MLGRRVTAIACAAAVAAGLLVPATAAGAAKAKPAKVRIYKVYYDSPGSDRGSNASLNKEWVALKNYGGTARDLYGYTVRDKSSHVYKFGHVSLKPGKRIYVHTGKGKGATVGGSVHRYQNKGWYIWNNTKDGATLRTRAGTKIDTCSWGSRGKGYKYC